MSTRLALVTSLLIISGLVTSTNAAAQWVLEGQARKAPVVKGARSALEQAAEDGDTEQVAALYAAAQPSERLFALVNAFLHDHMDVVNILMQQGFRENPPEIGLEKALKMLATSNKVSAIKKLCEYGANPNWGSSKERSALHAALDDLDGGIRTDTRAAKALLDCGADPRRSRPNAYLIGQQVDTEFIPVLHDAVGTGDVEFVERILSYGVDVNERGGAAKRTVLFREGLSRAMVKLLLSRGADARLRDASGASALAYVACHPGPETDSVIGLLIEADSPLDDVDNSYDAHGATALICAAKFANVEAVRQLLNAGADPNRFDRDGGTAMGVVANVARSPDPETRTFLRKVYPPPEDNLTMAQIKIIELLVAHGARADLDSEVAEHASHDDGSVGTALVSAMQSSWTNQLRACMKERSSVYALRAHASPQPQQPAGDSFTPVTVTTLDAVNDVSPWFSISPDGRWLSFVYGERDYEGQQIMVYDLVQDRNHIIKLSAAVHGEDGRWRRDSKAVRYSVYGGKPVTADLSGPQPQIASDPSFVEAVRAGGDLCDTRDRLGMLVGRPGKWKPDGQWPLHNPVTGVVYELVPAGDGQDVLLAIGNEGKKVLVKHDLAWVRARWQSYYDGWREISEGVPDDMQEEKKMTEAFIGKFEERARAVRLELRGGQLAPSGRYLYYETVARGGDMFGPPTVQRRFVVDLQSYPVPVWEIIEPVVSAYWHPNGRELFMRLKEPSENRRRPTPAHLAVARFP